MNHPTLSNEDIVQFVNSYNNQVTADFIRDDLPVLEGKVYAMIHCVPLGGILFLQKDTEHTFLAAGGKIAVLCQLDQLDNNKSIIIKALEDETLIREYKTLGSFRTDYKGWWNHGVASYELLMEALMPSAGK